MDKASFLSEVERSLYAADPTAKAMMLSYCRGQIESLGPEREAEAITALGSPERVISAFHTLLGQQSPALSTQEAAPETSLARGNLFEAKPPYETPYALGAQPLSEPSFAPKETVQNENTFLGRSAPTPERSPQFMPLYSSPAAIAPPVIAPTPPTPMAIVPPDLTAPAPTAIEPPPRTEWSAQSITPVPQKNEGLRTSLAPALQGFRQSLRPGNAQTTSAEEQSPNAGNTLHKTRVIRPLYPSSTASKSAVPTMTPSQDKVSHGVIAPLSPTPVAAYAPPVSPTTRSTSVDISHTSIAPTAPTASTSASGSFGAYNEATAYTPPSVSPYAFPAQTAHALYTAEHPTSYSSRPSPSRLFPAIGSDASNSLLPQEATPLPAAVLIEAAPVDYYGTPKLAPLEEEGTSPYTPPPRLLAPKGATGILGSTPASEPSIAADATELQGEAANINLRKTIWPFKKMPKAAQGSEGPDGAHSAEGPQLGTNGLYASNAAQPADVAPSKAFFLGKTRVNAIAFALLSLFLMILALALLLLGGFGMTASASIIGFCFALISVSVAQGITTLGLGLILFAASALLCGITIWFMYRLFIGLVQNISTAFPELRKQIKPLLKEEEKP